jgi:hypothetical protein
VTWKSGAQSFLIQFKHPPICLQGTLLAAITVIVLVTLAITAAMPSQQWNLITILSVLAVLYVLAMAYQVGVYVLVGGRHRGGCVCAGWRLAQGWVRG